MSWIKNIIILIKLLKRLRDSILPNLEKTDKQITELNSNVEKLWGAFSMLADENGNLKLDVAKIKGFMQGMDKVLTLQNQLIQILLLQLKDKSNGQ